MRFHTSHMCQSDMLQHLMTCHQIFRYDICHDLVRHAVNACYMPSHYWTEYVTAHHDILRNLRVGWTAGVLSSLCIPNMAVPLSFLTEFWDRGCVMAIDLVRSQPVLQLCMCLDHLWTADTVSCVHMPNKACFSMTVGRRRSMAASSSARAASRADGEGLARGRKCWHDVPNRKVMWSRAGQKSCPRLLPCDMRRSFRNWRVLSEVLTVTFCSILHMSSKTLASSRI